MKKWIVLPLIVALSLTGGAAAFAKGQEDVDNGTVDVVAAARAEMEDSLESALTVGEELPALTSAGEQTDGTQPLSCPAGNCIYNEDCPRQECPNGGVPARDGTGYRSAESGTVAWNGRGNGGEGREDCPRQVCPNGGVPARDGTGYRRGAQENPEARGAGRMNQKGRGYAN